LVNMKVQNRLDAEINKVRYVSQIWVLYGLVKLVF
jgi:hypothetical protein